MELWKSLLLLAASMPFASAVDEAAAAEEADAPRTTANLAVKINTTFPASEVFGIKLINGRRNEAAVSVTNNEPDPLTLLFVGGSLWTPEFGGDANPSTLVRNLTVAPYREVIQPGASETFGYGIQMEMHPVDLVLRLTAVMVDEKGAYYTLGAFEGGVSVVEREQSWLDPQVIFLYLVLLGGFGGTAYFVYNTWITTLFPQQKRKGGKGGERAKASSRGSKTVDPSEQIGVAGADGPAVTTATMAKGYDESWIPQHHINRPEAKRIRSGTPSGVKTKKAMS